MGEPVDVERVLRDEQGKLGVGAGWAVRNLTNQGFEAVVQSEGDPVAAAVAFSAAIVRLGRLLSDQPKGAELVVVGVVGGGFLNLNPTVIEVRITALAEGWHASLTGTAKEGLIRQATAEKAVRRVVSAQEVASIVRSGT